MSKLWTILLGMMLAGAAQAQTTDFKWNAELRTRYTTDMNAGFFKASGANRAGFNGRTKLGVTMMKGDTLTGHVTMLHNNMWGDMANVAGATTPATHNTVAAGNLMLVQEAWGWWKSNEMLSMKFGRAGFEYGDGAIFSLDDWQTNPNSWEGIWTQWGFDFADLHFFGTKLWDGDAAVAGNDDPEVVAYGLVFNFKNLPEFFKHAFVHVVTINADAITPLGGATLNRMHYGLTAMGESGSLDYRLTADVVSGKQKAATDTNLASNMFDFELGWNMPEMMRARLALMAHMDSGDTDPLDDKNGTYTPLYPDTHKYAGLMDIVGWGNSTYYGLGFTVSPSDDLNAGVAFLAFTRSSDKAAASGIAAGPGATGTALGSEIDLHMTKTYGENFSILGFLGMFTPGEYAKGTGTAEGHNKFQLQAKLNF